MNILLVEDDDVLAETTATLIEGGGHQVYITDEPTEVFRQCESGHVDVVIMDVHLPGSRWKGESVSGADLSRLLKTQPETANIPIILLTAYALVNERKHLIKISQADSFFSKPILDFDLLLEKLNELFLRKLNR